MKFLPLKTVIPSIETHNSKAFTSTKTTSTRPEIQNDLKLIILSIWRPIQSMK